MQTSAQNYFHLIDYAIFLFMLLISILIGIYYGFFAKVKQNTTSEYLLGGKTMHIFPISMSLISSYISGNIFLAVPAEIYVHGTQYWIVILTEIIVSIIMVTCYLPVFYTLQITSSYEYLNLRFSSKVRFMGSCLFIVKQLLFIPIVTYVPALTFSQVSGINLHLITVVTSIICIFYTTLGGLKAVVWADTVQTIIMFGGMIIVIVLGTIYVGGADIVWRRNLDSGRIDFFNFDWDPTIRHTVWTLVIGNTFQWLSTNSVSQAMVQRYLAMATIKSANITVIIFTIGVSSVGSMACYTGLVIYANFYNCDPITTRAIQKPDQLVPYFVMLIGEKMPGLPGIFVSCVFSGALSSMSTGLNSMTGVILEDLIKPYRSTPLSEERASLIMKIIVIINGMICVGLVFAVEKMGALLQLAKSTAAITAGPLLGLFTLGMFFPWANDIGALLGGISSLGIVAWISIGTQLSIARGLIRNTVKPISVEGCDAEWLSQYKNTTRLISNLEPPFFLYRLSYLYYTMIGMLTVIIIGLVTSFITGPNNPKNLHPDLFAPIIKKFFYKNIKKSQSYRHSMKSASETERELQALNKN